MNKYFPKLGDKLYLRQFTGSYYVDMVKRPYTVIDVSPTSIIVQSCELIFPVFHYNPETMSEYYKDFDGTRPQFFNSIPETILPDITGSTEELTWHSRKGMWGTKGRDSDYPEYAIFGEYEYFPYLD